MSKYQVLRHEHIFEAETAFAQCHASTLEMLDNGDIVAAWFGGTKEGDSDVCIWLSRRVNGDWTPVEKVADGGPYPCWNPVLHAYGGKLFLYYKAGPDVPKWFTMVKESSDVGKTWSEARELVPGDIGGRGPVKNKCVTLKNGNILAPASLENQNGWDCFTDLSSDGGKTWKASPLVPLDHSVLAGSGIIQPTVWEDDAGLVHMLTRSSEGVIYRSTSSDGGAVWAPARRTKLPNNNSGIDLARLSDGRLVLIYNPVPVNWGMRTPVVFSVSEDNGESFGEQIVLDHDFTPQRSSATEFSYPAIIARGQDVYITYTWKRRSVAFWQIRIF